MIHKHDNDPSLGADKVLARSNALTELYAQARPLLDARVARARIAFAQNLISRKTFETELREIRATYLEYEEALGKSTNDIKESERICREFLAAFKTSVPMGVPMGGTDLVGLCSPPSLPDPELAVAKINAEITMYAKRVPEVWNNIDKIRRERRSVVSGPAQEQYWPKWCFLPFLIAESGNPLGIKYDMNDENRYDAIAGPRAAARSLLLDTLLYAAWRQTKGIYVFDPTLHSSLWQTTLNGKIPHDVITRLPEWGTLITLPPGTFAQACSDNERAIAALCSISKVGQYTSLAFKIIFSTGTTATLSLPLFETLQQSLDFITTCIESPDNKGTTPDGGVIAFDKSDPGRNFAKVVYAQCSHDIQGLISSLLYLCSEEPDVSGRVKPAVPVKTKKGPRIFPPNQHTVVNVGLRIGAILRRPYAPPLPVEGTPGEPGKHASPRPHTRNAHWHLYWKGPKAGPQVAQVKWLSPILVNAALGDIEPVARPVTA